MNVTLSRNNPLPMYHQLKELLREKIALGEWQPGSIIPSERELSGQYGISRMTARQALNELTTEGILFREQGRGTFVSEPKIEKGLARLTSFSQDMKKRSKQSGGKVLRLEMAQPLTIVQRALRLAPGQEVFLLERLRKADGEPIALEVCHLYFQNVHTLLQEDFENRSLYDLLRTKYEIVPTKADQQVGAARATQREQMILNIEEGSPILKNFRLTYDQWGRPFEYTESAYRADRYVFQAVLGIQ